MTFYALSVSEATQPLAPPSEALWPRPLEATVPTMAASTHGSSTELSLGTTPLGSTDPVAT